MLRHSVIDILEEIVGFCDEINDRIYRYHITSKSITMDSSHADLILMPLCQIGEVVQRNRDVLDANCPEMPWHQMAGLRNVIVHGYTTLDADTVWETVQIDIPRLLDYCQTKGARYGRDNALPDLPEQR